MRKLFLLIGLILAGSVQGHVLVEEDFSDTNLIAHYTFDEGSGSTAVDASGNGNNGTLVNGPVWVSGKVGTNALDFDGADDYVDLGNLDIPGNAMTIAAWFNSRNLSNCSSQDCRIVSKATGVSTAEHFWMLSTWNGELRFRLKTDGTTTTLVAENSNLSNDIWYHMVAVYDGSEMRIYQDGVLTGSVGKTGSITTDASVGAWIGSNPPNATSQPWDGQIDDLRIYDRVLTDAEITELVAGTPPPPDSTLALLDNIAHWYSPSPLIIFNAVTDKDIHVLAVPKCDTVALHYIYTRPLTFSTQDTIVGQLVSTNTGGCTLFLPRTPVTNSMFKKHKVFSSIIFDTPGMPIINITEIP